MSRTYTRKHKDPEPPADTPDQAVQAVPSSEEPDPKPKAKSKKRLDRYSTNGDLVEIWERRMLDPSRQDTPPIRISTPGMSLRWINLSNKARYQRARFEQGWEPIHRSELVDEREVYGATFTNEGHVCRGERQSEMLMKMPTAVLKQIQRRQGELNQESYTKLRQQLGSAGHAHFSQKYGTEAGDQAASAAGSFVGSVKFGTERVSSDELLD